MRDAMPLCQPPYFLLGSEASSDNGGTAAGAAASSADGAAAGAAAGCGAAESAGFGAAEPSPFGVLGPFGGAFWPDDFGADADAFFLSPALPFDGAVCLDAGF